MRSIIIIPPLQRPLPHFYLYITLSPNQTLLTQGMFDFFS